MKVAVSGKGGTGKTTISATLARLGARRGYRTLAIDCDSNPNLGASLGLGFEALDDAEPLPKMVAGREPWSADRLVSTFGVEGPDGVTLVLGARVDQAAAG
ncbi:MAG: AAA family ATPase [Actinomycetota bacterium]